MADPPVMIVFTVELSNGHFRSQIRAPFPLPEGERDRILSQWFEIMMTGFKIGATSMDVEFPKDEPRP